MELKRNRHIIENSMNRNMVQLARLPEAIVCSYSQSFVPGQHSAVGDLSGIHAQTIITFVFLEHTVTRASMPKP